MHHISFTASLSPAINTAVGFWQGIPAGNWSEMTEKTHIDSLAAGRRGIEDLL